MSSSKRVICAMSGGVDSSATAKLLLDAGYEVVGVTMQLIHGSEAEIDDARKIARRLGIPHQTLDYRALFDRDVMTPFCEAYLNGETPNPCVECNKYLKFGALQELRRREGFNYLATGHYAQIIYNDQVHRYELHRALDPNKDQSYVLYHLSQDDLAHTLLPLSAYTKDEVRSIAQAAGFQNAKKPDSQDICFIPEGDYASFIADHTHTSFEPGTIVDESGTVLGIHQGLVHYTIGQRKGLGVAVGHPLFVLEKRGSDNTLVVGPAESVAVHHLEACDVSILDGIDFTKPQRVFAKVNYRSRNISAVAQLVSEDTLRVTFLEHQRFAAPGQAVVLYDHDCVVAGGTIHKVVRCSEFEKLSSV